MGSVMKKKILNRPFLNRDVNECLDDETVNELKESININKIKNNSRGVVSKKSLGYFYRMKNKNLLEELEMYGLEGIRKSIKQVKDDIKYDKEEKFISKTAKPEIWQVVLVKVEE